MDKADKSSPSLLSKLSYIKDQVSHVGGATRAAWEKSLGSADFKLRNMRTWPKAAILFISNFIKELREVEDEEKKVKEDTEKELKKAVGENSEGNEKDVEAPLDEALTEEKLGLEKDVEDDEELSGEAELAENFYEEIVETSEDEKIKKDGLDDELKEKTKTFAEAAAKANKVSHKENKSKDFKKEIKEMEFAGVYTLYYLRKKFSKREDMEKFFEEIDKVKSSKVHRWKIWLRTKFQLLFNEDVVLHELFPKSFKKQRAKLKRLPGVIDKIKGVTQQRPASPEYLSKLTFWWDRQELRKLAKILYSPKAISAIHAHFKKKKEDKAKEKEEAKKAGVTIKDEEEESDEEVDERGNIVGKEEDDTLEKEKTA